MSCLAQTLSPALAAPAGKRLVVLALAALLLCAIAVTGGCDKKGTTASNPASDRQQQPSPAVRPNQPNAALIAAYQEELRRVAADYDRKIATAPSREMRANLIRTRDTYLQAVREKWERRAAQQR